jgi:hypothetical protein
MLKKILIALAVALAAVLLYAATKPDSFSVQRSATIKATPDKLFALINSPQAMKLSYEGAASGTGAAYSWRSEKMGAGRMEVIESVPSSKVAMKLAFDKPMQTTNRVEFTLAPQADQTLVTWTMSGPMPYLSKLMTTFFNMDKMVGGDFDKGLANLKAKAEAS